MRWLPALLLAVLALLGAGAWLVSRSAESGTLAAGPAAAGPERPPPAAGVAGPVAVGPEAGLARAEPTVAPDGSERVARADDGAGDEEEADEGLAVTGRVVDAAGRPLPGATVYGGRAQSWGGPPLDSRFHSSTPWSQRSETTTDDEGRFRLEDIEPGAARLAVRAPGFAPYDDDALAVPEPKELPAAHDVGELRLERGLVLWGRVVDPAGYGVAAAELVRVDDAPMFFFGGGGMERGALLATSAADGSFRVDVLAPGPWQLMVLSAAHPDEVFEGVAETLEEGGLVFRLAAGADITGRVEGGDLDPSEVVVRASPLGNLRIESLAGPLPWREVHCDAQGRFELGGLEPGNGYRLRARTGEDRPWQTNWLSDPLEAPPNARDVVLPLLSTAAVSFRPVAADSEAPLTDVAVRLVHRRGGDEDHESLEPDDERLSRDPSSSAVTVTGIRDFGPEVRTTLTVEQKGFRPASSGPFTLVEGETLALGAIALEPRPMMSVLVTDGETGEPVEGAEVELWIGTDAAQLLHLAAASGEPFELESEPESHDTTTDADGIARVPRAEDADCQLSASAAGYADTEPLEFRLPSGEPVQEPAFELVLWRGGTLEVLALEPSGAPATEASVTCTELVDGGEGTSRSEPVDAQGVARFEHLPDGRYRAQVEGVENQAFFTFGDEPEPPRESRAEVQVVGGETVRVTLTRPPRGVLAGRVTEGGRALAGAALRLESAEGQRFHIPGLTDQPQARTDGGGRYRLGPQDAGSFQLVIVHPSRIMDARLPVELVEGDTELDVELPITVVEGLIRDADGLPIEGARVEVAAVDDHSQRSTSSIAFSMSGDDNVVVNLGGEEAVATRTGADGRYQLRGVLADTALVVTASHPEHVSLRSEPFEVGPGEVQDGVDLVLSDAGRLEAVVTRAGAPLGNTVVRATFVVPEGEQDPDLDSVSERTDGQGRALLGGLTPGTWSVQVQPPGWDEDDYPAPQLVTITAGTLTHVDLGR